MQERFFFFSPIQISENAILLVSHQSKTQLLFHTLQRFDRAYIKLAEYNRHRGEIEIVQGGYSGLYI